MVSQTWAATIMQSAGATPSCSDAYRYTAGAGLNARQALDAELSLEQVAQSGMFQRTETFRIRRRVRQRHEAKSVVAQSRQPVFDVGVSRHGEHRVLQRTHIVVGNVQTTGGRKHPEYALAKREEVDVVSRQRCRHRVHDQLAEPLPHRCRIAENALENRCYGLDVDEGLVDVEDEN